MTDITALIQQLADPDVKRRDDAKRQLISCGEAAAGLLLETLQDPGNDSWLRVSAARVLRDMGDCRALAPMLAYFNDTANTRREGIALCFARLHNAQVVERLLEAMDEPDVNVRSSAMCSLVTIGEPRTREKLLAALERVADGREPDEIMRGEVITATRRLMIKLNDRESFQAAREPLQRLLKDPSPDPWIQKTAARTLAVLDSAPE